MAQYSTGTVVHDEFEVLLAKIRPDAVYLFNGRQFDSRPVLRLCQKRGIEFYTYECAVMPDRFKVFRDATPHDNAEFKRQFRSNAGAVAHEDVEALREAIKGGKDIYQADYRRLQVAAQLPEGFDPRIRNVTILHSSEDEYVADGFVRFSWGKDFEHALSLILDRFADDAGLHFYLRIHPRLAALKTNEVERLCSIMHARLTIVRPDSSVNTFELATASTVCLCYGSTAGIEAALIGARVLCMAECWYDGLGILQDVRTMAELAEFLAEPDKIACNKELAAAYLNFVQNQGELFLKAGLHPREQGLGESIVIKLRKLLLRVKLPYNSIALDRLFFFCFGLVSLRGRRRR
jgi:hypothetical protein